jgi:CheY-like chemotaxis protein
MFLSYSHSLRLRSSRKRRAVRPAPIPPGAPVGTASRAGPTSPHALASCASPSCSQATQRPRRVTPGPVPAALGPEPRLALRPGRLVAAARGLPLALRPGQLVAAARGLPLALRPGQLVAAARGLLAASSNPTTNIGPSTSVEAPADNALRLSAASGGVGVSPTTHQVERGVPFHSAAPLSASLVRVLVVDDEPRVAELLHDALIHLGYAVRLAAAGRQAQVAVPSRAARAACDAPSDRRLCARPD